MMLAVRQRGLETSWIAFVMWLVVIGLGCARGVTEDVTLAGSTSLQPFAEQWVEAYRANLPGVQIHVQGGGSTAGVQAVISGAAQIGMCSRALTRDEAARVTGILVARDGMAIVVHPTNPVKDLTLDQVRGIYAGQTTSWRSLGGTSDAAITIITREEGSGTRAAFEELVMARQRIAASALVQDSTGAVRQMVASDPAAVGYVSLGLVDASVKALAIHGVAASEHNIDRGSYPLVRPFLFLVPRQPRPGAEVRSRAARAFLDWIAGPDGRNLTRRQGLLPPKA